MTAESSVWNAYAEAVIRIEAPGGVIWVRPAPVTRTAEKYPDQQGRVIYVMTAHNPSGQLASDTANAAAEARFAAELERREVTWWPAAGGNSSWTHVEPGAAVIGMDEADALALGAEFGQDAIFVLTTAERRVVGCTGKRVITTGWSTEPDAEAGRHSLAVPRTCRAWSIGRSAASVRTSCTGSRRPQRVRSRRRHGRRSRAPADAPARLRLNAGQLARRDCSAGAAARTAGKSPGRGGFDKGTLAAALIGLLRAGRSQPDPRTSVRAAAPCQIHHSVGAKLTVYVCCRKT
jgi:Protein of unknown function (DUF3293)